MCLGFIMLKIVVKEIYWQNWLLSGGHHPEKGFFNDVLMLTEDGEDWIKTGTMKIARDYHGASAVPGDMVEYCK